MINSSRSRGLLTPMASAATLGHIGKQVCRCDTRLWAFFITKLSSFVFRLSSKNYLCIINTRFYAVLDRNQEY